MAAPEAAGNAGGSPQYTHFQLDDDQIEMLREALDPRRVGDDGKGHAAVEQWDIRRTLIRVFGFGRYGTELLSVDLVREIEQGSKYTVVYRVTSRLTVMDRRGNVSPPLEDGAVGDAKNQPKLGDAHDLALKSAISGALKRCAVNLGDQFGLSLYSNGSVQPVVATLGERYRDEALKVWEDRTGLLQVHGQAKSANALREMVMVDGDRVGLGAWIVARGKELVPAKAAEPAPVEQAAQPEPASDDQAKQHAIDELSRKAQNGWDNADATFQNIKEAEAKGLLLEQVPGPDGQLYRIGELLTTRLAELRSRPQSATVAADNAAGRIPTQQKGAA